MPLSYRLEFTGKAKRAYVKLWCTPAYLKFFIEKKACQSERRKRKAKTGGAPLTLGREATGYLGHLDVASMKAAKSATHAS